MKSKKKLKICFTSTNPAFSGGTATFLQNLIQYLEKEKPNLFEFTWIYSGKKNKKYAKDNINFVEIKSPKFHLLNISLFNFRILGFLKKNFYDIINSHLEGLWMDFYKKKNNQKIIQTFHGMDYYFFKCHLERFGLFKKILISPILAFSYLVERPPMKKADRIICVSQRVKREFESINRRC